MPEAIAGSAWDTAPRPKKVIVSALYGELSRKGLNSDNLPPLFRQRAGLPYGCGMGRPYGGNYGQAPE